MNVLINIYELTIKMKFFFFLGILISIFNTSISINPINLRRNANGFRVLMSRNYANDIGDFLLAFLKSSKIEKKVKSLSECMKNISETLSTISYLTQSLSQDPNILNIMSFLSTMDQTYTNVKNHKICANVTEEFKSYLDSYINDPKLGKGDSYTYFTAVLRYLDSNYKEVFFQLKKTYKLVNDREFTKAGNLLGSTLRNILEMKKLQVDLSDITVVVNSSNFGKDGEFFKNHIVDCENAVGQVFPDIYNFYRNATDYSNLIPSANDLIKSISEASSVFKCFLSFEKILSILKN
jgi:hypothetical protein